MSDDQLIKLLDNVDAYCVIKDCDGGTLSVIDTAFAFANKALRDLPLLSTELRKRLAPDISIPDVSEVEVGLIAARAVDVAWQHTQLNEAGEVWIDQLKAIAGVKVVFASALREARQSAVEALNDFADFARTSHNGSPGTQSCRGCYLLEKYAAILPSIPVDENLEDKNKNSV